MPVKFLRFRKKFLLNQFRQPRRVVITGIACVTAIGIGGEEFWSGLQRAERGVRRIELFDASNSPVKIAAEVIDFEWRAQLNVKDRELVPRTVPLALAAAREAFQEAGIRPDDLSMEERQQIGVVLSTASGVLFVEDDYAIWY